MSARARQLTRQASTRKGDRQLVLNGRSRFTPLVLIAAIGLSLSASHAAQAEPDIEDVRARVNRLYHEAEQAQERYNDAQIELQQLEAELESVLSDEARQEGRLDQVRADVRDSIIQQHQAGPIGDAGELLSADAGAFLRELSVVSTVADIQASLLDDYNDELKAFTIRREETDARRDEIAELEQQLAREQQTVDAKAAEAQDLLDELEDEEREAMLSRGSEVRAPEAPAVEGRAAAAVEYAMAQVGKAYVWGAAGPNAFDCSGLTMMAWAQAGVSLPHSSSMQYSSGTQISQSALRPGDLVFYYSPISHVAMYIGNGQIVDAANPGAGVRIDSLNSMPYVGAVRPG